MNYVFKKILIIDDDASLHDLCGAILSRYGYRCISAYSGEEGLNKIREESPDLILLDVMMPGMDGYEVYNRLLSHPDLEPYRRTPVIMLTAIQADDQSKSELLQKGISAYLNKPFGLNELVNVIQSVIVTHEVQQRNIQLQEEISRAKQYLERIIDHAPMGILVVDWEGKITRANAFLAKMLGVEHPRDLIGRSVFDMGFVNRLEIQEAFRKILEGKEEHCTIPAIDIRNLRGEAVKVNIQCVPLRDEKGELTDILGIWEDVTEVEKRAYELSVLQKISEAMQKVLDLDLLLHLILTSITAGCALGFSRAIIFMVNEEARMLEGRMGVGPMSAEDAHHIWETLAKDHANLSEFLTKFGLTLPSPNDHFNNNVRYLRISLENRGDVLVETVLQKKGFWFKNREEIEQAGFHLQQDFERFFRPEEFVTVPLIAKDRAIAVVVADNKYSGMPLTEDRISLLRLLANQAGLALENAEAYRNLEIKVKQLGKALHKLRETQEKLVRSEQLATVGRMAAHVAHEIRNPLTAIGGFAKSILKNPQNVEQVKLGAKIIDKEVRRLENILRNVLNFTRVPRPYKRLNDLNTLVREVLTLHQPLLPEGIQMEVRLDETLPRFFFDEEQIKQALMNVIANSISSIKREGKIRIRTYQRPGEAVIEVADTGVGMSREVLENIFNPFFTTRPDGTGLGLSVTNRIIEGHDGRIEVESEVGRGTTFRLVLPLVTESAQAVEGTPQLSEKEAHGTTPGANEGA